MRSYHMVTYMLVVFLLCTCMYGCSSEETDECVEFRTYNLESAQKVVPFTLILPTYLPSNLPENPIIRGPLGGDCYENNEITVDIEYWSDDRIPDGLIIIYECNYPFHLGDPALNPDIKNIEIGGIEVREWGSDQGLLGSASYEYSWDHKCICFIAEIHGYDHDVAVKVVESMIQQLQ